MNYTDINSILLVRMPELKSAIEKEYEWWNGEEPPPHCLYESAFNHSGFMRDLLFEEINITLINKVFDFFEDMANCDDYEVRCLLKVTLLEYLWGDFDLLNRAHKYMHTKTRELCDELQVYFKPFTPEQP